LSYFTLTWPSPIKGGNSLLPSLPALPYVIASEANAERGNLHPLRAREIASAGAVSLAMTGGRAAGHAWQIRRLRIRAASFWSLCILICHLAFSPWVLDAPICLASVTKHGIPSPYVVRGFSLVLHDPKGSHYHIEFGFLGFDVCLTFEL
jgi:hypothetical protein